MESPPHGDEPSLKDRSTERGEERAQEDDAFVPVVVKRSDEARRHPDDTLQHAVKEGLEQLDRPTLSLALSSVAAGLIVGFSVMAAAVVGQTTAPLDSEVVTRVARAFVYPIGFIICILSGTQLFTEHTATAVYPVLDGKGSLAKLLRLWLIVIAGNLLGAAGMAFLLSVADPVIQSQHEYESIGRHLIATETLPLLTSSLLAGWLMAQGAWLISATSHAGGQMMSIYLVTFLIAVGGLHHSIAGSAEMFTAVLVSDQIHLSQTARFIGLALIGNLVGGSIFVALLNYAHIRAT